MDDAPRVSVILPVRNRRALLVNALEALSSQTYRDFEIVVVDDGSDDGSDVVAEQHADVRLIRTARVGAVRARRVGVDSSRGEILAFTDSDCAPCVDWLEVGVAAVDKGCDVVQGVTLPERSLRPLERSIHHRGPELLFATCNVFYTRESYESAGGFDIGAAQRLGFHRANEGRDLGFGEDTLLGWKVARVGRSAVAQGAVVFHAVVQPRLPELLWRSWMARGFPFLVKEVPELRSTLLRQGVFLGWSRLPIYAALAAFTVRRREVFWAATLWWVFSHARTALVTKGSFRRRVAAVPIEMSIDVVMALALWSGSLRSRSAVL